MTPHHWMLVLECGDLQASPQQKAIGDTVECRYPEHGHVGVIESYQVPGAFRDVLIQEIRTLADRMKQHLDYLAEIRTRELEIVPAVGDSSLKSVPVLRFDDLEVLLPVELSSTLEVRPPRIDPNGDTEHEFTWRSDGQVKRARLTIQRLDHDRPEQPLLRRVAENQIARQVDESGAPLTQVRTSSSVVLEEAYQDALRWLESQQSAHRYQGPQGGVSRAV